MKSTKGQQGFTLTEIMVVIGIIAILVAIALPTWLQWLPNMRLQATARNIFSTMQLAKAGAIRNNQEWRLVFTVAPGAQGYTLFSSPGADNNWITAADNATEQAWTPFEAGIRLGHATIAGGNSATTPPGPFPAGDISYANATVIFNPNGTCNAGFIYLQNQDRVQAVGTLASGIVRVRKHQGGAIWQ